jgi:hypothetical protein
MLSLLAAACARDRAATTTDLLPLVGTAERRAGGNVEDAIRIAAPPGEREPALLLRAPARLTFTLQFPAHARLTTTASLLSSAEALSTGVTLRVGVSDDRRYDGVFDVEGTHEPQPLTIDLSRYGGWQWSLFYRPWETTWKLIINADAKPGGTVALRRPAIE